MTSLVTGASGFLGSHVVEKLCQRGEHVKILARKTSNLSAVRHLPVEVVYGDLHNVDSIMTAVADVDTIFHCAGSVKHIAPYGELYETNVMGTKNITIAAAKNGVKRIVYASSLGVYGTRGEIGNDGSKELNPSKIKDNYCRSKAEAEIVFFKKCAELNIEGVALRPGVIYGPRDYTASYYWFKAVDEGETAIVGDGNARFPLIYVADLVEAFVNASERSGISGNAYDLDGPDRATLKRIYDLIAKELGKIPDYRYYSYTFSMFFAKLNQLKVRLTGDDRSVVISPFVVRLFGTDQPKPDCRRAQEDLGFAPKTSLEEGIKKTAEWYKGVR
ncbi:MAG: NAD-dependent epimerase/dehydratase family protein [Methanomassiliicoccales archaeon]|jgi:nucleoside-diphosphate-sugar epimerase|nr:NAD-dependent epimerase/dehydratase family protein [Methanomassiliicoccales archaeon]